MRGYGRDYDNGGRNWIERAGETVRGWFGGARDYDRDFGYGGNARAMHRDEWHNGGYRGGETDWGGGYGGGYRMNNWNNQHSTLDTVRRAAGGYYGADYDDDRGGRGWSGGGSNWGRGNDYGRDYNAGWGGMNRGQHGGSYGTSRGVQRFSGGGGGGMNRGGMQGGMNRGGQGGGMRDTWLGNEYGGGGYNAGNDWGDYNRGAYGGNAFRNSRSGGVEPGRYFDGYGIGSSGGQGYEPY